MGTIERRRRRRGDESAGELVEVRKLRRLFWFSHTSFPPGFGGFEEMGSIPFGDFSVFGEFSDDRAAFRVGASSSFSSPPAALVLDEEIGELVRAPPRLTKKGAGCAAADARTAMALKSHSEAEKRRRERINGHLTSLRKMIPCSDKLDKAGLLAEVINHIKKLKSNALEISKVCTIPSDFDEVRVEVESGDISNGSSSIKISFCCDDRPDLLADLKQTLQSLQLNTARAEISTLGSRVKFLFVMTTIGLLDDIERHLLTTSIHQALKSVLDRANSTEFFQNASYPSKWPRTSQFESSCSSS